MPGQSSMTKGTYMTRKEFEKFRMEVEAQKFHAVHLDPITYGIERLMFEKSKFTKLIAAAEAIPMKTTRAKAERWKRKMQRANSSLARLQQIRDEMIQKQKTAASPFETVKKPAGLVRV
jgi:hypothetical protein